MFGLNKRMYIIEGDFPDDIGIFLNDNDIPFHMTGFIEHKHRIVFLTKVKLKLLKRYLKTYKAIVRKM